MIVSVVVGIRNMSIIWLSNYKKFMEAYTAPIFIRGVELYVRMYLVYVFFDDVVVSSFSVVYD